MASTISHTIGARRQSRRWRRIVVTLLSIPFALLALGVAYEALMAAGDARRYPPPGNLVDIGGRRMHLTCAGFGGPTVIFEAGHGGNSLDWTLLQQQLADEARVCAYDRAGSGWSDPGPLPRTPERIVADLHALLQASGEPGPYVLVGHSLGGRYVRLFAATYPKDVAGIVLVDARSEYHDRMMSDEMRALIEANNQPNLLMTLLGRVGIMRLFGAQLIASQIPELKLLPADVVQASLILGMRPTVAEATGSEFAERIQSDDRLVQASFGDLPVRVLVSQQTTTLDPNWLAGQEQHAAQSANSVLQILDGGHYLQLDNVVNVGNTIMEVIQAGR